MPAAKSLARLLALAAGLQTGIAAAGEEAPQALTIVSWGGSYEASQRAAYFRPFTEETGIPIEVVRYDGDLSALREHIATHQPPEWDVIDLLMADARSACRRGTPGALRPIHSRPCAGRHPSPGGLHGGEHPGVRRRPARVLHRHRLRRPRLPRRETAQRCGFLRPGAIPGGRALRKAPVAMFEWALRAYGVPRRQIYDLLSTERGLSLALRKLDEIRPALTWWHSGADPVRMLEQGQVAMASVYNGRAFHAQAEENAPISVIWDSQLLDYTSWAIPRGTPQKEAAGALHPLRHPRRAPGPPGQSDLLWPDPRLRAPPDRTTRGDRRPHAPAHAHRAAASATGHPPGSPVVHPDPEPALAPIPRMARGPGFGQRRPPRPDTADPGG
ncbi:MAG: extracellular solute-binding protein [Arhodomonas sp.]|nr:extracellular solute-binding protein [Arhodomonas sp.]